MPLENLNSNHFTAAEKTAVTTALTSLETILVPKLKNLTPEERKKYGSINEQNKLVVNKVNDYRISQPALCSTDVDWVEFQNDFESRTFIEGVINRLESMVLGLDNSKILHDFDNFKASLVEYGFAQYKAGTKAPGYETKANELAQFFSRTSTSSTATDSTQES
jgi:hypothetical protein